MFTFCSYSLSTVLLHLPTTATVMATTVVRTWTIPTGLRTVLCTAGPMRHVLGGFAVAWRLSVCFYPLPCGHVVETYSSWLTRVTSEHHSDERLVHQASELAAHGIAVALRKLRELHEEHVLLWIDGKESGCPASPPILSFGAQE